MDPRIKTITETLHELQSKGKYTVFYDYSGHINALGVRIYKGEWDRKKSPVLNMLFSLDHPDLYDIIQMSRMTVEEFTTNLKTMGL